MDLPEPMVRELAIEHGLCGLLSHTSFYFCEKATQDLFLQTYQKQLLKNILFLDEFTKINASLFKKEGVFFTPLKGLSLLKTIYELGDRPMTDMDVYTKLPSHQFIPFLEIEGYQLKKEKKWHFNQHKWVFNKPTSTLDFTLEVHTKLLPQDSHDSWPTESEGRLHNEDEFLYLVAHWAQQHTCLKLFWLFDIYFYQKKHQLIFNASLWDKAQKLSMTNSLKAAAYALESNFQIKNASPKDESSSLLSYLMSPHHLLHLSKHRFKYLLLKHLLKDSAWDGITYDVLWLKDRIESHLFK